MENKKIIKIVASSLAVMIIAGLCLFNVINTNKEIKELESKLVDTEFSLNVLNLSNQELKESKELYVSYFNTNGLYNEFYGELIVLNYIRGSLDEQTSAWDVGDVVYVNFYGDALETYKEQLEVLRNLSVNLSSDGVSNLWIHLDEEHELKGLIESLDINLVSYNLAYEEMLSE